MRAYAWTAVLTVAFVFASSAFLVQEAAGQLGSSPLSGQVCAVPDYGYPAPLSDASGAKESCEGQALPGASVHLTKAGLQGTPVGAVDQTATTDDNGVYSFASLEDGTYHVAVSRTGFSPQETDVEVAGAAQASFMLEAVEVEASGTVLDDGGDPVPKAEVRFCCPAYEGEKVAVAGADGSFQVRLKANWYSLTVRAPGFQDLYEYRLVDGAEPLAFTLQPVPPQDATVRGTVRDQDGDGVAGVRVWVYSYGPCCEVYPASDASGASGAYYSPPYYGGENWTDTDAQGRYEIHIYSGSVSLRTEKEGYATAYRNFEVAKGETVVQDVEILKFPDKTAHVTGRVVDAATGEPVGFVSVNLRSPQYGIYECSQEAGNGSAGSSGTADRGGATIIAPEPYPVPGYSGCAITVSGDGSFEGDVTPGYAILQVWHDHWRTCTETTDADGDYRRECGPEYLGFSRTLVLPADATTDIVVELERRAEPDAVVSGYLVDAETGKAVPQAQISFSNQDNYGWGSASTDQDGSYRIRLRSGYHMVSVWAEGFLPWEGVLQVPAGEETPFDVSLTPGQEAYGFCCPVYRGYAEDSGVAHAATGAPAPTATMAPETADTGDSGDATYEDLNGGLGPYNAAERARELSESTRDDGGNGAPGIGILALLGVLAIAALAARRRT